MRPGFAAAVLVVLCAACGDGDRGPGQVGVDEPAVSDVAPDAGSAAGKSSDRADGSLKQLDTTSVAPKAVVSGAVYRFAKISNGAYFYTADVAERDHILRDIPDLRFEDIAFASSSGAGSLPVYRFANLLNGGYFYTASEAEKNLVISSYPHFRYEGTTFSVEAPSAPGAAPVYRLANLRNGAYLYTADPDERDAAVRLGIWRNEGVSFHVAATPTAAADPSCAGTQCQMSIVMADSCNDGQVPTVRFFDRTSGGVWGDYYLYDYDRPLRATISCTRGHLVCAGAFTTNLIWGVGELGTEACTNCCATCAASRVDLGRLTCN